MSEHSIQQHITQTNVASCVQAGSQPDQAFFARGAFDVVGGGGWQEAPGQAMMELHASQHQGPQLTPESAKPAATIEQGEPGYSRLNLRYHPQAAWQAWSQPDAGTAARHRCIVCGFAIFRHCSSPLLPENSSWQVIMLT